ncbi:MAG: hypothetical protein K5787_03040 [Lentisphaeria bacterium]|nr:hypothetical protein [Victivallales bacterium]MCR4572719.1 hypothetical protein [Lentisphaeria bacterium]
MSLKANFLKNALMKIIAGGFSFAVLHAIVFWIAYFQCGGAHNSAKGIWQGLTSAGSTWATILKWTGFPLASVGADGFLFVLLMLINSLLWGAVIGLVLGLVFGRK